MKIDKVLGLVKIIKVRWWWWWDDDDDGDDNVDDDG